MKKLQFEKMKSPFSLEEINDKVFRAIQKGSKMNTPENLIKMFSCLDLTTLNNSDDEQIIEYYCNKLNQFNTEFKDIPLVAAFCIYPHLVKYAKKHLKEKIVKIASVAGNFPTSMTFSSVKGIEIDMALKDGANEIDMVMPMGLFKAGKHDEIFQELSKMKAICGKAHLKIILETGTIDTPDEAYRAAMIALHAGADFIKTSTGKVQPAATPEAVVILTSAIRDYYEETGNLRGIKPAGGISSWDQALTFFAIIHNELGEEYTRPEYFRIGASKLANSILSEIKDEKVEFF